MGIQKVFIENLKFYRKQKKISQKDLSIALDKGFNYINSIECGVSFPPPAVIDEIARLLDIDSETLFSKKGCPQNIRNDEKSQIPQNIKDELISNVTKEIQRILG